LWAFAATVSKRNTEMTSLNTAAENVSKNMEILIDMMELHGNALDARKVLKNRTRLIE